MKNFFAKLFHLHSWEESKRTTSRVYETWDWGDPLPELPTYRVITVELRCKKCGDLKIVKYKTN